MAEKTQQADDRDDSQRRMDAAAEALFNLPVAYEKIHEFDEACQPDWQHKQSK